MSRVKALVKSVSLAGDRDDKPYWGATLLFSDESEAFCAIPSEMLGDVRLTSVGVRRYVAVDGWGPGSPLLTIAGFWPPESGNADADFKVELAAEHLSAEKSGEALADRTYARALDESTDLAIVKRMLKRADLDFRECRVNKDDVRLDVKNGENWMTYFYFVGKDRDLDQIVPCRLG